MRRYTLQLGDNREILPTLKPNSVDSIVTDPPYGLSFMGKDWDHGVPGVHFWQEAFRVAKPGAHLLAFGGTRTFHRLAVAIEDAGWEIRDTIMWVYGSGFPKSLDVSKAIDSMDAGQQQEARRYRFTQWVRSQGVTAKKIDKATGTNMGGHYTTAGSQPAIMTREHLEMCRHLFGEVPEWVERECDIRSIESQNMADREIIGHGKRQGGPPQPMWGDDDGQAWNITAPATPEAAAWQGWGTALKPAHEPIIVARKPLEGTVAQNVLKWGTGAINVDGCRIEAADGVPKFTHRSEAAANAYGDGRNGSNRTGIIDTATGRWPANLVHDGSEEVLRLFPNVGKSTGGRIGNAGGGTVTNIPTGTFTKGDPGYGDTGSAARFFYCAKASKADRDEGLNINPRWLDSVELIWDNGSTNILMEVLLWENQDRNQSMASIGEALHVRGISGDTTPEQDASDSPMSSNGNSITATSLKAIRFTTSTGTRQTIESKTLNWLMHLPTSEYTADVIKTLAEYGLSRVEGAALQSLLRRITTSGGMAFPRGVSNVPSRTQPLISARDVMQQGARGNIHSTVKPTSLMRWLVRLVTPPGGTCLDPFMGSGSTGKAAMLEGFDFLGMELDPEYLEIARARIEFAIADQAFGLFDLPELDMAAD